jgi:4'-phosphopantetheinyl transferase
MSVAQPVTSWSIPTAPVTLADDEVHIWRASLKQPTLHVQTLFRTLTPDERERAGRFHFEKDRDHFTVARGLLRAILGLYLYEAPERLRFTYSSYGKPCLSEQFQTSHLTFNVSHAHEIVVYALTRARNIGVDIEHHRPDVAGEEIAERFFSANEVRALFALPGDQRAQAFFNCWTRKEAYIKARGEGLSHPLDQFDVSLAPGEPAALLETRGDSRELSRWTICAFTTEADYSGALAVEGHGLRFKYWRWLDRSN